MRGNWHRSIRATLATACPCIDRTSDAFAAAASSLSGNDRCNCDERRKKAAPATVLMMEADDSARTTSAEIQTDTNNAFRKKEPDYIYCLVSLSSEGRERELDDDDDEVAVSVDGVGGSQPDEFPSLSPPSLSLPNNTHTVICAALSSWCHHHNQQPMHGNNDRGGEREIRHLFNEQYYFTNDIVAERESCWNHSFGGPKGLQMKMPYPMLTHGANYFFYSTPFLPFLTTLSIGCCCVRVACFCLVIPL